MSSFPPIERDRGTKKPRRRVIGIGILVLLAAIAAYWYFAATPRPLVQYQTVEVTRGPVVAKVTASGTLSALVTVQVGSQVSGRIETLYVDYNSKVKKGQLLAKIDPKLFQAAVEQARANLVAANGNLAKAKAQAVDAALQYQRAEDLFAKKVMARSDLDTARANADSAQAAVQAAEGVVAQAKAALSQAQVNLAYTDILSPTDGIVISRNVDVGQTVAASLQAPTLFVVAQDLRKMQVDTNVAESDIGHLRPGMEVDFTVDAYPMVRFRGKVREIRNNPQTVQNVVTYDAVVDVNNADLRLKPGMTADVIFVYARKDDALRVPDSAFRFHPGPELVAQMEGRSIGSGERGTSKPPATTARPSPAKGRTLWVLRNGRAEPVSVETGINDGTYSEIMAGEVTEGDRVVTDAGTTGSSAASPPGRFQRGPF